MRQPPPTHLLYWYMLFVLVCLRSFWFAVLFCASVFGLADVSLLVRNCSARFFELERVLFFFNFDAHSCVEKTCRPKQLFVFQNKGLNSYTFHFVQLRQVSFHFLKPFSFIFPSPKYTPLFSYQTNIYLTYARRRRNIQIQTMPCSANRP